MLAKRARYISASSTLKITAQAKALIKQGKDVVNFAAGEPDFDTPDFIKNKAIQAIQEGYTKYTPSSGSAELKAAISAKFAKDNRLNYSPNQIVVSCGAKHSLFNTIQVFVEDGDEVIIPSPFWLSYPEMVKIAAGSPVILEGSPDNGFKISAANLKKAITKKTKLLIINSPANPTGSVYTESELLELAKICVNSGIYILSDEIYEKLIYDSMPHISIGSLGKEINGLTITVNGVSKSFSMTGWRIGYLGAPIAIAEAISKLQDHSTSNPSSISQRAAQAALEAEEGLTHSMRDEFQKRRDYIIQRLQNIKNLSFIRPQGAFYVFINISQTKMPSSDFALKFLNECNVAVIPGDAFGNDNYIRISFATGIDAIKKGMDRLEEWVGAH